MCHMVHDNYLSRYAEYQTVIKYYKTAWKRWLQMLQNSSLCMRISLSSSIASEDQTGASKETDEINLKGPKRKANLNRTSSKNSKSDQLYYYIKILIFNEIKLVSFWRLFQHKPSGVLKNLKLNIAFQDSKTSGSRHPTDSDNKELMRVVFTERRIY